MSYSQQQDQQQNDNITYSLPPIREACAGTISFQQSKKTDFVVLPPLTPTPLTTPTTPNTTQTQQQQQLTNHNNNSSINSDDVNIKENLTEAVATCTFLCQEIEQLRKGWTELTVQDRETNLDQLSKAAQGLLYALKQDNTATTSSSSIAEEQQMTSVSMEQTNSSSTTSSLRDSLSTSPEYVMIRRARNLQDSIGIRQSYRRRAKKAIVGQRCHSCHTAETPEWRRGPDGARTLCNACGLHYSKLLRRGSLTVQRGYSIEDVRSDRSTPPPTPPTPPPPPRVIEYPVQGAVLSSTQHRFPNRVGLGIGSITTGSNSNLPSTTTTTSSTSTINHLQSQHQQIQQQHNTPFINYMSSSSTEYHHRKDDPP